MPKIKFLPGGEDVTVDKGTILLDAALDNDIEIDHNCGGNCVCSTCHVWIEEGLQTLSPPSEDEKDMLEDAEGMAENSRLACQCEVTADLVVKIPTDPT